MPQSTHALLLNLLARESVTPNDAGCQDHIATLLTQAGFTCRHFPLTDTDNLFATHGNGAPLIAFVGHTDVVPAGELSAWQTPPFTPVEREGKLYARGAADMKSGVAAMTTALMAFVKANPNHRGTVALLLTSDEEGSGKNGIKAVLPILEQEGVKIDYAIVGEPTASAHLGDTARSGRRGSLNLTLTVTGKQGHVAYPEQVINPIATLAQVLSALCAITWDTGYADFPPTSMQVSNISGGTGAENVVPASAFAKLNWRYNPAHTAESLQQQVDAIIAEIKKESACQIHCAWQHSGAPFSTADAHLRTALKQASDSITGQSLLFNTAGGTSDARFLAAHGSKTVEYGPSNESIHQVNECVLVADLEPLSAVYELTLTHLLSASST